MLPIANPWDWFDMDDAIWLLTHELDAEIISAWDCYFTTQ